ncbi:MAG: thiosulfohydrolase SoxB [Burkholderiales bacterium]|jgi:sulfur-oxidizing protein SoxB
MNRREFLQLLAAGAACGMSIDSPRVLAGNANAFDDRRLYDIAPFGNVSLLHFTDCHAQLLPLHYREPAVNIGVGAAHGKPPHLVGDALLKHFGIPAGSAVAHAFTCLDFSAAAQTYGKVGGFAHLASLVKQLRGTRPGALLLDGGDTWQGSASALWTQGQDMVDVCLALGVDVMTGHWEFTYGAQRVNELLERNLRGHIDFVAQNIRTTDFEDPVFPGYVMREVNGVPVAIIGQAYPYTKIANPAYFVPDWSFGIRERELQNTVDEVNSQGAQLVILLSHNGMDIDLKLASRVSGIDAILGGHTHDAVPAPIFVDNPGGRTLVTNAGSNGKFLGVLDFDVRRGRVFDVRYRLLPVFSNLLPADPEMSQLIAEKRRPYTGELGETLALTDGLLYRRGNFNGSFDDLILQALMDVNDTPIAFSPGFRWGPSILPGQTLTREDVMNQTAITYPSVTVNEISGEQIKAILEDVCDNLFNPDPYYQQGGDMVRVGGMTYACAPHEAIGSRISDMRLNGEPISAQRKYRVAGWASISPDVQGTPVWNVVESWLRARRHLAPIRASKPRLIGVANDPGIV